MKAALVKSTSHALYTFHFHSPACIISLQCKFLHRGGGGERRLARAPRNTFPDTENGSSPLNREQNNAILFTGGLRISFFFFFWAGGGKVRGVCRTQTALLESEESLVWQLRTAGGGLLKKKKTTWAPVQSQATFNLSGLGVPPAWWAPSIRLSVQILWSLWWELSLQHGRPIN